MYAIEDAVDAIRPFVPGAPDPAIEDTIRTVAEEICRRAGVWRVEDDFPLEGGQEYLSAPAYTRIIKVLTATANGRPLRATTVRQMDMHWPEWRASVGDPTHFYQVEPDSLRFAPVPERPVEVHLDMLLSTTIESRLLPEVFRHEHRQLLNEGVIFRLQSMPGVAWSAPENALLHGQRFEKMLEEARCHAQRGQQGARFLTKTRFF